MKVFKNLRELFSKKFPYFDDFWVSIYFSWTDLDEYVPFLVFDIDLLDVIILNSYIQRVPR